VVQTTILTKRKKTMTTFSQVYSPFNGLTLVPVDVSFSAAPVSATLAVKNGTTSTLTLTSIRGEAIGNATTFAASSSTNAASVSLSGYAISAVLHVDGTNGIDTKVSDVKALIDANTNITALVTAATTKDDVMVTNAATALAGGDDKMTDLNSGKYCTLVRDLKGVYTLTLTEPTHLDHVFTMGSTAGDAGSSGVAKVEVVQVDDSTMTVRTFDYANAAGDVTAAADLKLAIALAK
jgi:hypothetical protein